MPFREVKPQTAFTAHDLGSAPFLSRGALSSTPSPVRAMAGRGRDASLHVCHRANERARRPPTETPLELGAPLAERPRTCSGGRRRHTRRAAGEPASHEHAIAGVATRSSTPSIRPINRPWWRTPKQTMLLVAPMLGPRHWSDASRSPRREEQTNLSTRHLEPAPRRLSAKRKRRYRARSIHRRIARRRRCRGGGPYVHTCEGVCRARNRLFEPNHRMARRERNRQ